MVKFEINVRKFFIKLKFCIQFLQKHPLYINMSNTIITTNVNPTEKSIETIPMGNDSMIQDLSSGISEEVVSKAINLSNNEKINERKISLGGKVKQAITSILNKIKSLFKFSSKNESISQTCSKIEEFATKLEAANYKIETQGKIIKNLADLQKTMDSEKKTDPVLAQNSGEIEKLQQEIEKLKELLKNQQTSNVDQKQTLDVLGLIKNDTSESFISNTVISILNKKMPPVKNTIPLINVNNGGVPPPPPGTVPPPPPLQSAVPPPPQIEITPKKVGTNNIQKNNKPTGTQITQESFNELAEKVFNFIKNGQNLYIDGLSKAKVDINVKKLEEKIEILSGLSETANKNNNHKLVEEYDKEKAELTNVLNMSKTNNENRTSAFKENVNVKTAKDFNQEKESLTKVLNGLKAENEKKLEGIDKNIEYLQQLCEDWLKKLPENLTLKEANELKEYYASDPIKFFTDVNKLKKQKLIDKATLDELNKMKASFTEDHINELRENIKNYNEENSKIQKWTNELYKLKLTIPNDKTTVLLKELINNYKGESFDDFVKAHEALKDITSKIKPLTEEQKKNIAAIDQQISETEKTLNDAKTEWLKKHGKNEKYNYTGDYLDDVLVKQANVQEITALEKQIKELKAEKAKLQKDEITLNKLLQELIDKEKPVKGNSLQRNNMENQKKQEEAKKNDYLGDINRGGFKLKSK